MSLFLKKSSLVQSQIFKDRKQNVNETWTKLNLICWFPPSFLFDNIVTNVIFYVIMTSNLSFHDHLLAFFVPSKKCWFQKKCQHVSEIFDAILQENVKLVLCQVSIELK